MGKYVSYFLNFIAASFLSSCAIVLNLPLSSELPTALQFTSLSAVSTYTCAPITVNAVNALGNAVTLKTNKSVTLSGLGQGTAYSTLSDCKAGTNSTSTVFITAGNSRVTFYFRTSTAESLTFSASTNDISAATVSLTANLFQILGQPGTTRNLQLEKGISTLGAVHSDGTRLFVVDRAEHRVLVWNSLPTTTYTPPDFALGQPNLTSTTLNNGGISGSSLSSPMGVFSDGTHLFVTDTGNHRILIWNTLPTTNGQSADVVLGQPNLTSNTQNNGGVSATSSYSPNGVCFDGTRLFVADSGNYRVLVWNTLPTTNGQAASFALGQPNLTSNTQLNGGTTGSSFYSPVSLFSDSTRLFVTDGYRVLAWNSIPTTSGQSADFALGQPNLTSLNITGISATSFGGTLNSIFADATHLFVSDAFNNRILIWNSLPTTNGQAADIALGQPNLTSGTQNNGGVSGSSLTGVTGIFSNGTRVYVADSVNYRVLGWNSIPSTNGQAADFVLGQANLTSSTSNYGGLSASIFSSPNGVASNGTQLFVADASNNRVLVWNSLPLVNSQPADFAIGQPDLISNSQNNGGLSGSSLNQPLGVFSVGTRLFVADSGNNRVLIWNTIPTSSTQSADLVLGQTDLISNTQNSGGLSASSLNLPYAVTYNGTQVFVADTMNHRVLGWNAFPTANAQAANFALGQTNLTSNTQNSGGISGSCLRFPMSVSSDGTHLFVVDNFNHRVLVWNSIPSANAQVASFALGQPNLNSLLQNNGGISGSTLASPYGVYCDGTRVYVADRLNNRLLVWNSIPTGNGQTADYAVGQPNLTSSTTNYGGMSGSSLSGPRGIFSDGTRLFIGDSLNNRILFAPVPGI